MIFFDKTHIFLREFTGKLPENARRGNNDISPPFSFVWLPEVTHIQPPSLILRAVPRGNSLLFVAISPKLIKQKRGPIGPFHLVLAFRALHEGEKRPDRAVSEEISSFASKQSVCFS